MISYQYKAELFSNLTRIFEDELEWIVNRQYTSEQNYKTLLELIQSLPQRQEQDMTNITRQLASSFQGLSISIGDRIKSMIDLSINQINMIRQKMGELEYDLHKIKDNNEVLEETRQGLEEKVAYWEKQYDILKNEAIEMQKKFEEQLRANKIEEKELKKTFIQVQQQTEEDRKLLENLQVQKFQIHEKIEEEKKQKQSLLEEIGSLKRKIASFQKMAKSSEGKFNYSQKKITLLQEEISQKNKIIEEFYESQRPKVKEFTGKDIEMITMTPQEKIIKRITQIQSKKLADEININSQEFILEETRGKSNKNSILSINSQDFNDQSNKKEASIIEEELEESRIQRREVIIPDIYFSHYLLTVQSIKLKINKQECYHIDMSNYYQELVSSTVPFHKWDDWIRQKLENLSQRKR